MIKQLLTRSLKDILTQLRFIQKRQKATCPECGRIYKYKEEKPSTCGDLSCRFQHLHPVLRRDGIRKQGNY